MGRLRTALMLLLGPPVDAIGARVVDDRGGLAIAVGQVWWSSATESLGHPPRSTARGAGGTAAEQRAPGSLVGEIDLDAVINEYTPAVYRLARSVVRDPALADDVTQETFIKVWKHVDDYRGEGSVRGWVLRIAHNTAVSTLRRVRDSATDPAKLPDAHDPISTNRVVEGRLAHDDLQVELDRLDELSREIVVLREVEGLSYDEIADALDVPIPTVKTRLLRARRRLAVALEGWRP